MDARVGHNRYTIRRKFLKVFGGEVNARQVLRFNQHFNPFILKMDLDFSMDTEGLLDRRLGLAAALLLAGIEGRQN